MSSEQVRGGYFSRNYLQTDRLAADDQRMRLRLAAYLRDYCDDSGKYGEFIERELGIKVTKSGGYGRFVIWEEVLSNCSIKDFLDIVTAIAKFCPKRVVKDGRIPVTYDFIAFAERLFREQRVSYKIDREGGVHPFVDKAFSSEISLTLSGFSDERLRAARHHIETAERYLLASDFQGREAIRSIFDAVENIFKLIFPKSNQLNNANIANQLKPLLSGRSGIEAHEKRATEQLLNSLKSWVEAGHNYRHEPGSSEPPEPSDHFCIQYVSQGIGFSRWLGNHYLVMN